MSEQQTTSSTKDATNSLTGIVSSNRAEGASQSLELENILAKITRFASPSQHQSIEFLASSSIPSGRLENKSISDMFIVIEDVYTRVKAVEIFKIILSHINLNKKLIVELEEYIEHEFRQQLPIEIDEDVMTKLSFHAELLQLIDNHANLHQLVEEFDEERQLDTSRANIDSPVKLLQQLLHVGTIAFEKADDSCKLIREKIDEAGHRKIFVVIGAESKGEYPTVEGRVPTPPPHVACCSFGNVSSRTKKLTVAIVIALTVCLALILIGLPGATIFGLTSQTKPFQMNLYKTVTVLVSGQPINTQYHNLVNFELCSTSIPRPDYTVCQFDCSESLPVVRTVPLLFKKSDNSNNNMGRRFAKFTTGSNAEEVSSFMLANSTFTITLSLLSPLLDESVSLYLFNDPSTCNFFFGHEADYDVRHQIGPVLYLNASNGYNVMYNVPPGTSESYYCAVMDLPPNITFNYTMTAAIVTYDVDFYQHRNQCVHTPKVINSCISYNTSLQRRSGPFTFDKVCVLLKQENDDTILKATTSLSIDVIFNNPPFVSFIVFVIIGSIVSIIVLVAVLLCVCRCSLCVCTKTNGEINLVEGSTE